MPTPTELEQNRVGGLVQQPALWAFRATAAGMDAGRRSALAAAFATEVAGRTDRVLLITCHRVELYGVGSLPAASASPGLDRLEGAEVATHLLRVAAGLESAVVGEDEVLHQVREALRQARAVGRLDTPLSRLFEIAISTGRLARAGETAHVGLAGRAVAWLGKRVELRERPVVVGGSGRMGAALARALLAAGAEIIVASRDPENATRLASRYGSRGVGLDEGAELAIGAAALAVALAGPWPHLAGRDLRLPIADLSWPSAVPPSARRNFLGIDELFRPAADPPRAFIAAAKAVVAAKAAEYMDWSERQVSRQGVSR